MNRKAYYGCRVLYNLIRVPLRKMVYFSGLKMPIIQNISPNVRIRSFNGGSIVVNTRITIEDGVLIEANGGKIIIDGCFINRNTTIVSLERIHIKKGVTIGPNVAIYDHDHNMHYDDLHKDPFVRDPVTIGKGVWIGANTVILKGVTVGDDAVIAAGSVVTSDIEPHSIVAGVPAKKIGNRE